MSIRVMTDVWEHSNLKAERLLVMLALADWADENRTCFPKVKQIARKARVSEGGASEILSWLEMNGFVEVISKGGGRGKGNEYLLFPKGDRFKKSGLKQPETLSQKGGFEPGGLKENPQPETPLPEPETPMQKPPFSTEAYKEEPSIINKVLTVNEEEEEFSSASSPEKSEIKTEKTSSPVRVAVMEICGLSEKGLRENPKWVTGLRDTLLFLRSLDIGDAETVAAAVRDRYAPGVWPFPNPPHPDQIETYWPRMSRALELKAKPNEVNNESKLSGRDLAQQRYGAGRGHRQSTR